MSETPIGAKVPLLFSYRDVLFGNGFVAEVRAQQGRALCVRETDGFWMYGVNPGGMAAFGSDAEGAHAAFRSTFSRILKDLALEAHSFDEFHVLARHFFDETNAGYEPEWYDAVQAVRNHEVGADLPTMSADSPRSISVAEKLVPTLKAEDNEAALEPALAA